MPPTKLLPFLKNNNRTVASYDLEERPAIGSNQLPLDKQALARIIIANASKRPVNN